MHRDRQVVKALLAERTRVKFTAKLQGLQRRQGMSSAKATVRSNLKNYSDIAMTPQIVRNDLTNMQQYSIDTTDNWLQKSQERTTHHCFWQGKKLKCNDFPKLGLALECAFGEIDTEKGGGGLEAYLRLTTCTLYRGVNNVTTMRQAREILPSMAPEGFNISLSACYNYTENYRQGSAQAKRHHSSNE